MKRKHTGIPQTAIKLGYQVKVPLQERTHKGGITANNKILVGREKLQNVTTKKSSSVDERDGSFFVFFLFRFVPYTSKKIGPV